MKMNNNENDCYKVNLHELAGVMNLISLGMAFLDPLDQQITDQTSRSKHLTFNCTQPYRTYTS